MAKSLNADKAVVADYQQKSTALKNNIIKHLYDQNTNTFDYLIDQNGHVNNSQEGLGISFAVIFGIADKAQAKQVISQAKVSKYGITSIYPDFPRFSHDKPGRHNNIIWPMVNGFFAKAAITAADYNAFTNELYALTHLALDEDKGNYDFREIYNGVIGLRFNENALVFMPYLPEGVEHIELKDLAYRNSILKITIKGKGSTVKTFTVDGRAQKNHLLASTIQGRHEVYIEVE